MTAAHWGHYAVQRSVCSSVCLLHVPSAKRRILRLYRTLIGSPMLEVELSGQRRTDWGISFRCHLGAILCFQLQCTLRVCSADTVKLGYY